MSIRMVSEKDFDRWFELWEAYNAFYNRVISREISEITWNRFLNDIEPVYALVAETEGQVVGFATYLFHRHTAQLNHVCYLQDLFTDPNFRNQGIGKALLLEVSKRAQESGSTQLYWMTHESNTTARKIYESVAKHSGFIVYSRKA